MENFTIHDDKWQDVQDLKLMDDGLFDHRLPEDFPLSAIYLSFPENFQSTPNYHHFFEICYVYEGKGIFIHEDKQYPVEKGDIFIVSTSRFHSMKSGSTGLLKTICLTFFPEVIYQSGTYDTDYLFLLPFYYNYEEINHRIGSKNPNIKMLTKYFLELVLSMEQPSIFQKQAMKVGLYNLLLHVLICYEKMFLNQPVILKDQYHLDRLKKVLDFIQENYQRQIQLDEIAELSGFSKTYLCKYFKRITGRSINEYIIRCRLNEARRLLIYTDTPISQIAYGAGFNSHSYFNRTFTRIFHQNPSEFRDVNRS